MNKEQIEQLALDCAKSITKNETYQFYIKEAFRSGFEKASELLYTEQEVEDSIKEGVNIGIRESKNPKAVRYNVVEREVKEYIQSLKQQ